MNIKKCITAAGGVLVAAALSLSATATAAPEDETLLRSKCSACHVETDDGFSRISHQRKTPEGWLMSIARMQISHDLKITDPERRQLVKYLADTQGLAPAEAAPARYILERRLNTQEAFESEEFTQMCARCHSGARTLLQRRPAEEWEHLVHHHVGEFVTLEYQDGGRDRDWLNIALDEMVPYLGKTFPLESDAWSQWQQQTPQSVLGNWTVAGHMPGRGSFSGTMTVGAAQGKDAYGLQFSGRWQDGAAMAGQGQAIVYTGYEWRGSLELDGVSMQQVFALQDGELQGRMFMRDQDEVGADVVAMLETAGASRILAVQPGYLKAGEEDELRIVGVGLDGELSLPSGLALLETISRSSTEVVARVRADAAAHGLYALGVGAATGGELAVYQQVAEVRVLPDYAVARIGGEGAPTPKVEARFDAEAWDAGADGKLGTDDDFRVGIVPATWLVEPFDDDAKAMQDVRFSGVMDAVTGVFMPAAAGPNPERRLSTNNAGNLKVVAQVDLDGAPVRGEGQLIVGVQRWNNPPIR